MDHEPFIATTATGRGIAFSRQERERHLFLIGKSGSGKSTTLFNLAMSDIEAGQSCCLVDPHGDLAEAIVDAVPRWRTHDVCYLNVADTDYPVGFNPFAGVPPERHALAAAGIVASLKNLFPESWGPRLEHFLFNGVAALFATPRPTILDLPRLYTDEGYRERVLRRVEDPIVLGFWRQEYASYDRHFQAEAAAPILNKVGQIIASPVLRNILGQTTPKFDLQFAMDGGSLPDVEAGLVRPRIFIANLAKGRIGEQAANLLGSLLISQVQLLAMARSDRAPERRPPFWLYVDEFSSFTTDAFASLLSEARKYGVHFCLATQFLDQTSDYLRAAVLGNVGTLMVFRVSAGDADILAPEFHPLPTHQLTDQSPFGAWLRGLDTGHRAIFLEPPLYQSRRRRHHVVSRSRRSFGRHREVIEQSIRATSAQFSQDGAGRHSGRSRLP